MTKITDWRGYWNLYAMLDKKLRAARGTERIRKIQRALLTLILFGARHSH
jgi:hypothetical protein